MEQVETLALLILMNNLVVRHTVTQDLGTRHDRLRVSISRLLFGVREADEHVDNVEVCIIIVSVCDLRNAVGVGGILSCMNMLNTRFVG